MSVSDSQRDLISVQVGPMLIIKVTMIMIMIMIMIMTMMMMMMMMMMLSRSAAPPVEAWEEHLARWARTGTGSCGGDSYAGGAKISHGDEDEWR